MCCHVYVTGAHKRTHVVHQNMPNHHISIYCVGVYVQSAALKGQTIKRFCLACDVDLYAPQEVYLGGGGSLSRNGMIQYGKWPEQQNM